MKNILVTNGLLRKTLSITRSLGKKGLNIYVSEVTYFNPSSFSKYCKGFIKCPDPLTDKDAYYTWLKKTIINFRIDVFFPTDDAPLNITIKNRIELEKLCKLAIPSTEPYEIVSDKALAVKLAIEAGLDCPNTIFPNSLENLSSEILNLKFPVLIKPRKSSGGRGIRLIKDPKLFLDEYLNVHKIHPFPFVQEYLGIGTVIDAGVLCDKSSNTLAQFQFVHIRKYPEMFGPSVVQKSVKNQEIHLKTKAFLKKIKWDSVASVEFLLLEGDPSPKFLEINTRFWNSLHSAYVSGVDFPWMYYKLLTAGSNEEVNDYITDIYCRNILPGDILSFLSKKGRFKFNPSFFSGRKNKVYDDIIDRTDPLPILGFVFAGIKYLFDVKMWKFYFKR